MTPIKLCERFASLRALESDILWALTALENTFDVTREALTLMNETEQTQEAVLSALSQAKRYLSATRDKTRQEKGTLRREMSAWEGEK
ncbi:hypothetical protein MWH03_00340 [Klebsiella pneumoniae]|nr:hypothetical protein [Klebsiella pneumoniae]